MANSAVEGDIIDDLFTYHAPTPEQVYKYNRINESAKALARVIDECCPMSPDRTAAMRLLQQTRMTANMSIAVKGAVYR